ncbi:hypothetical protein Vretifemale_4170 [Volvox reticuliferus]|nr:hypothetical protein Vretifemale_4170 [Volvox reticuliferus]
MDFYVSKLEKHFEPKMISSNVSQYITLWQATNSPKSYLRQVRELVPFIREHYPLSTIARCYVMHLEPRVWDHVLGKYGSMKNKLWYERLGEIADYAEEYWQNLVQIKAEDEDYKPATASARTQEWSGSAQQDGARRGTQESQRSKYHCLHHGQNATHDTKDCRMLNGRKSAASTSVQRQERQD